MVFIVLRFLWRGVKKKPVHKLLNFTPMSKIINLFLAFCVLMGFVGCKTGNQWLKLPIEPSQQTLLWEISGKNLKQPSYIFGTFHLLCKEDLVWSENLKKAFAASQKLYLEMDLDEVSNTLGALFCINMKGNKTLKDFYTPEEYKRIETYFKDSLKMPFAMLNKFKPLMLESLLYPGLMKCKAMSGVEEGLMKFAKEQKKDVEGFENIQFQCAVFDSVPYEIQAKGLLRTIDSLATYKAEFNTMLQLYKTQQLGLLDSLLNRQNETTGASMDILLYNRNKNWVAQMKNLMPKAGLFVAVGAGHLPGPQGVLQLLRKEGYSVKPIKNL